MRVYHSEPPPTHSLLSQLLLPLPLPPPCPSSPHLRPVPQFDMGGSGATLGAAKAVSQLKPEGVQVGARTLHSPACRMLPFDGSVCDLAP